MATQQVFISLNTKIKGLNDRFNANKTNISNLINGSNLSKGKTETIVKLLEDMGLILRNQQNMTLEENKAKNELITTQNNSQLSQKSYSQALQQNNKNVINSKSKNILIIRPKNTSTKSQEIKKQIKINFYIIDLKVGVNKINNIKNNDLIIECNPKKE